MKEIILNFINNKFNNSETHFSYCRFPEENCSCKRLGEINYDTSLIRGGYIDSFSMIVILIFLQKTFNAKIPDNEATPENFDSINKMINLVNKFKK